jgi:hypothetical protein
MKKTLVLAAGTLLALSAGAGAASASVTAADLQQWLSSQLAAQADSPPDSVACPGDLDATVGASITCAVTRGDETRGVTVTVTSLDGDAINFNIEPARQ